MLQVAVAVLSLLGPTFDEAKADASKRPAYLAALLDPHVHDAAKNPKGLIKAWYNVADDAGRKAAEDAIKAEYKAEGREFFFAKDQKTLFAPIESPARRAIVWYRDSVVAGSNSHAGILLVGDVFALGGEDEMKSVVEDGALGVAKLREAGLTVKDLELDANIPALKNVSNRVLLLLWAQSAQLQGVLKGTRKVSEGFKAELTKSYLGTHQAWSRAFAHERKVYDDNNENTLQKEIVDFLDTCDKTNVESLQKAGVEPKLTNKETHEYRMEKK